MCGYMCLIRQNQHSSWYRRVLGFKGSGAPGLSQNQGSRFCGKRFHALEQNELSGAKLWGFRLHSENFRAPGPLHLGS